MSEYDIFAPHDKCLPNLPWKEEDGTKGANYVKQDGKIYAWSSSNCNYEYAWYLYTDTPLAKKIREERPIAEGWL